MGKEFNNGKSSRGIFENSIEIRAVQFNGIIGMITLTLDLSKDRTARREGRRQSRWTAHKKYAQKQTQM